MHTCLSHIYHFVQLRLVWKNVCDIQKQKFQMEEVKIDTHSSCFQSLSLGCSYNGSTPFKR